MPRSWSPEVANATGQWHGLGLRFLTQAEAIAYAKDLRSRWSSVREMRRRVRRAGQLRVHRRPTAQPPRSPG
jgi:hypothetical protein